MAERPTDLHVFRRAELLEHGLTRTGIERAVRSGRLRKLGRSWYGTALTPPDVVAALMRGNRLSCVSALELQGVWVAPYAGRHETCLRGGADAAPGVVLHGWLDAWPDSSPLMPLPIALRDAARCVPVDDAVILFESVANRRLLDRTGIETVLDTLPRRTRASLGPISASAQSGTETRVRRHFEKMGVRVIPQWQASWVDRVDLLVGERLIVECDSYEHHAERKNYDGDRRRDFLGVCAGLTVVRLTWGDVMLRWPVTARRLTGLIRDGRHRAPRRLRGEVPAGWSDR